MGPLPEHLGRYVMTTYPLEGASQPDAAAGVLGAALILPIRKVR